MIVATTTAVASSTAKRARSSIGSRWIVERNGISPTSVDRSGQRNAVTIICRDGDVSDVANDAASPSSWITASAHDFSRMVTATARRASETDRSTLSFLLDKYDASSPICSTTAKT